MIDVTIEALVEAAIRAELIDEQDRIYSRNRVLATLHKLDMDVPTSVPSIEIPDALEELVAYAIEQELI